VLKNILRNSLIALYVDDLLIACSNKLMCFELEKEFSAEFSIKIMGSVNHSLGMDVLKITLYTCPKLNILLKYIIMFNNMKYTAMLHLCIWKHNCLSHSDILRVRQRLYK
jgi:hypothetical protein